MLSLRLFELSSVDPPTKELDLIVGPRLIARHRAVFETSQDCARVLRDVVVLPEIEPRDAQHRRAISFPEERLHVLLEARPSTLDAGAHAVRIPRSALDETSADVTGTARLRDAGLASGAIDGTFAEPGSSSSPTCLAHEA